MILSTLVWEICKKIKNQGDFIHYTNSIYIITTKGKEILNVKEILNNTLPFLGTKLKTVFKIIIA